MFERLGAELVTVPSISAEEMDWIEYPALWSDAATIHFRQLRARSGEYNPNTRQYLQWGAAREQRLLPHKLSAAGRRLRDDLIELLTKQVDGPRPAHQRLSESTAHPRAVTRFEFFERVPPIYGDLQLHGTPGSASALWRRPRRPAGGVSKWRRSRSTSRRCSKSRTPTSRQRSGTAGTPISEPDYDVAGIIHLG